MKTLALDDKRQILIENMTTRQPIYAKLLDNQTILIGCQSQSQGIDVSCYDSGPLHDDKFFATIFVEYDLEAIYHIPDLKAGETDLFQVTKEMIRHFGVDEFHYLHDEIKREGYPPIHYKTHGRNLTSKLETAAVRKLKNSKKYLPRFKISIIDA